MDREISKEVRQKEQRKQFIKLGDTGIVRHGCTIKQCFFPISIRITIPFFRIGRMTILINNGSRSIVIPAIRIKTSLAFNRVIQQIKSILCIILLR